MSDDTQRLIERVLSTLAVNPKSDWTAFAHDVSKLADALEAMQKKYDAALDLLRLNDAAINERDKRIAELETMLDNVDGWDDKTVDAGIAEVLGKGDNDAEEHPDHCLCDKCVTPENMDERLRLTKERYLKEKDDEAGSPQ